MKRRFFRLPGGRERIRKEVDDEVRFHLERKIEKLMAAGLGREEAEREAARRFGDVDDVKREMEAMSRKREARSRKGEAWDGWRQDAAYALRQLGRNRVFATVAVLTLALGIGVNTAIFSVVDGILFRPLPFPDADELVNVWSDVTERGGPDDEWLSWANYHDLATRSRTLQALGAWGGGALVWTDPAEPEQLLTGTISWHMFPRVLRVEPALGRPFAPEDGEPGAPTVALLSHGFWERAFGSDPAAVGSTMTLADQSVEVVGVMPAGFRPPFVPGAELWTPISVDPAAQQGRRGGFSWKAMGRLQDGVTPEAARAELADLGARLEAEYPESNTGMTFTAVPLRDDMVAQARTGLLVLLGAVAMVLLVACVNVANLLLARASSRRSELALRSAMGAGRRRLVRQLLTESLVLAAVGGAIGVALAWIGTDALVSMAPDGTPRIQEVAVDGRVLAFTVLVTVLSGLLFGLVPAFRTAAGDLHDELREGGRGQLPRSGARIRNGLVVGQVAMALVLLVGAGLLVKSFRNLTTADLGFRAEDVVTFRLNLPSSRYGDAAERVVFAERLEERLAAIPGVASVGSTNTVPLTGFDGDASFHVEGRPLPAPGEEPAAWIREVTPDWFGTMGIQVVQGRGFTPADREGDSEVVVINETMAARYFPGENPVGKRLTFSDPTGADPRWREIVGVARDIRNFGIREDSRNAVYLPWAQVPYSVIFPALRVEGPRVPVVDAARQAVAELDPGLAVAQVRGMSEIVRGQVAPDRFVATLLSLFAVVALVLAVVGLYGVVSYGVSTRVREMGVRMALGAAGGTISRMVVRGSLVLVAIGLVLGLVGSWFATRLMSNLLFGVSATDPVVLVSVAVALALAATAAAVVPAVRATRIDPATALRNE
ncbi:MAG: ABC transporter permease [Gemmatimonadota bacterium]|jgi:predicted permease